MVLQCESSNISRVASYIVLTEPGIPPPKKKLVICCMQIASGGRVVCAHSSTIPASSSVPRAGRQSKKQKNPSYATMKKHQILLGTLSATMKIVLAGRTVPKTLFTRAKVRRVLGVLVCIEEKKRACVNLCVGLSV